MNIAILSRGPFLYSTQRLLQAGRERGYQMRVIDHMRCDLVLEKGAAAIYYDDERLPRPDAVIPRIGASVTLQGAAVISQMEAMQVFTVARSEALLQARDKLRCLQKLSRCGLDTPRTALVSTGADLLPIIQRLGGFPVVIKLLESTHGEGVLLAESLGAANATIEAFHRLRERVLLQEFIAEAKGADIRAFVVEGEVVAVMKRQARPGEFRSNLHRGASARVEHLTPAEKRSVLKAVQLLGLDVAGVDLLRARRGPLIMEVNASPGLEGIEGTTGVDIAGRILDFISKRVEQKRHFNQYQQTARRRKDK